MKQLFTLIFSVVVLHSVSAQEVELVIASGLKYSSTVSFSHNNQFVATAVLNNVSIWDVKTGRQIRKVTYTENLAHAMDSIWFSDDDKHVIVQLPASVDKYQVNVATGESTFLKSETPMDWTKYKYVMKNHTKSTTHLYGTSKKDLVFKSPDQKKEIIFRKVKNPTGSSGMMMNTFQIRLKIGGKETAPLDSAMAASFDFSDDSKFVLAENVIYELATGRKISELIMVPYSGLGVGFLPGTHTPFSCGTSSIRIWDFPNVQEIPVPNLVEIVAAPGYNYLVAEQYNMAKKQKNYVTVDLTTKKVLSSHPATQHLGHLTHVSKDAKRFSFSEMEKDAKDPMKMIYTARIFNQETGKEEKALKDTRQAFFTTDQNVLLKDSMAMGMYRYQMNSGKMEKYPTESTSTYTNPNTPSNDQQYILGNTNITNSDLSFSQKVQAWNIETGKMEFEQSVQGTMSSGFSLSADHKYVAFYSTYGNAIYVCEFASGKILFELKGHQSYVMRTAFSDDSKRLISSSMDGTQKVWNLEKGKLMVSLITTGANDYAIVTPDQYYYSTKGAQSSIHFVKGTEIFPFAQFDLKYNRPDIILERMLASNSDMIRPFNLAYQKRLKRLGFTEDMLSGEFHMPEVDITNKSSLPVRTNQSEISLNINGTDDTYKLDRILVRVNGVPIHGKQGIDIKAKQTQKVNQEMKVVLANGPNIISASVMNEKGVESIASFFSIEYQPSTSNLPDLHLFTVGVSNHKDKHYDLKYASKDANDLAELFKTNKGIFGQVFNHQLTNNAVTIDAIKGLREAMAKTKVNDVVCIFFAGHGLLDSDLNYFLASYDVDFKDPSNGGIAYELMEDLMDGIPARKKLMLLDACHSGEIDKDEVAMVETSEVVNEDIAFRAVGSSGLKQVGLNNSFELMKELFADIRKSSGTMIISSAGGTEYAMEGDQWSNGIFTYCLVNGLKNGDADTNKDGQIMMGEMSAFIREKVFELTNGQQQPTNRVEVLDSDWRLW
jgi:WD40 repeat protein